MPGAASLFLFHRASVMSSHLTHGRLAAVAFGLALIALLLAAPGLFELGDKIAFSLVLGALIGVVFQRSRFCFLCHARDFIEGGDASGVVAILVALGVGTLGYYVILGTWLPDPTLGRSAPDAHIGPVSWALVVAAFVFGVGMAISGACISGHLYRLGEGSPTAPFALVGTLMGFGIGFRTWNPLYIDAIAGAEATWLPARLGYGWWLVAQLALLLCLAVAAGLFAKRRAPSPASPEVSAEALPHAFQRIAVDRWHPAVGGAIVGVLGAIAYFRVQPLGVTAEVGSLARRGMTAIGALPETLHGLDAFAGCRTIIAEGFSNNGAFVAGLVIASFASALIAGQCTPSRPTARQIVRGLAGGVLLGWGAMTAIGCTVGTLLSGTMAGALSGWVFLFASLAGVWVTLPLVRAR